jgi:hypothetical protein
MLVTVVMLAVVTELKASEEETISAFLKELLCHSPADNDDNRE